MKNFQVTAKEDGKKYWISRSCAVVVIVVVDGKYLLVTKRGPGCPDEIGKWSFICGYLDWDESLEDAVARELYEEIGLRLPVQYKPSLLRVISKPESDKRQNVCFRYLVEVSMDYLKKNEINTDTLSRGGEAGEVEDIKLIPIPESSGLNWAFNHGEIVKELPIR